jgi:hypothetical protein
VSIGVAASMVPAYIQVLPPGFGTVVFPFNPEQYTVEKHSTWHATAQPASSDGGAKNFGGVNLPSMQVKILLDAFAVPPTPPEPCIAILQKAMVPSDISLSAGDAKPPTVMFGWGTNIIMEQAHIKTMSVTYQRFTLGRPIRAEVTVGLEAAPNPLFGTNPTSGGLATRRTHTVIEGDTLASVAFREYRDPNKWRALAEANGIDDPMRLRIGTVLLVPDPREVDLLA